MSSWSATGIGGASWAGSPQYSTRKQLLSTSAGLYDDLKDFNFSTISVSTLNVPQWISTALLYVSDIQGYNFTATDISSGAINVNQLATSTINMKAFDSLLDIDVSFDFGLGKAIGGVVGGLGALVGGATIAVGTGAGLAIQGAEQGIATMIAGRPQNFINNSVYETINFTSQLQISTLGNAYPYYSSIFRTVSSISANSVPGREIFTSTIFYPGQICIRSASDPINLITADSNLNTSTIQSFGQWVPLEGLEPENIVANSISTNFISAGQAFAGIGGFCNAGILSQLSNAYNAPHFFDLGSSGDAQIFGFINQFNFQSDLPIVFNQVVNPGTVAPSAQLTLGNGLESIFNVSSIYSLGEMKTVNFYASTITAETLNVVSTLFLTSTNIEILTSTQTLTADNIYGKYVTIENLVSSINFTTGVGNPTGPYDINKNVSYTSTLYNQVSSLTNNILRYQLNVAVQDEPTFNMGGQGQGTPRAYYAPTPSNTEQWASTMIICNPNNGLAANLFLGDTGMWTSTITAGTFDLTIDQTKNSFYFTCAEDENYRNPLNTSTFISLTPSFGFCNTYRFNINSNGWWTYTSPAPPPYTTTSCNILTINQDINDTNITTTDRLNITAGDTFFNGTVHIPELNLDSITLSNVTTDYLSTLSTANFVTDAYFNTNIWVDNAVVGASGNFSSLNTLNGEVNFPSLNTEWTSNYTPISMLSTTSAFFSTTVLQSYFYLEKNRPVIPLTAGTNNDMTLSALGRWTYNGVPFTTNYALGTFVITPIDNTFKIYTDNNGFGLTSNLQVVNLSNASSTWSMNLYIAFPSAAINIPANSGVSIFWNGGTGQWSQTTYTPWTPAITTSELDVIQSFNTTSINTTTTQMNVNVPTITIPNILQVNQIQYGPLYLQPKMFRQIINGNFGAGGSDSGNTQITNGSMTFSGTLYHCQCSIASFYCANGTTAFNTVVLAPYIDGPSNTWYVAWSLELNAASAGANWTISWNAFMFPNNMASP